MSRGDKKRAKWYRVMRMRVVSEMGAMRVVSEMGAMRVVSEMGVVG